LTSRKRKSSGSDISIISFGKGDDKIMDVGGFAYLDQMLLTSIDIVVLQTQQEIVPDAALVEMCFL